MVLESGIYEVIESLTKEAVFPIMYQFYKVKMQWQINHWSSHYLVIQFTYLDFTIL